MTALPVPVPAPTRGYADPPTVTPLEAQDITGVPAYVLGRVGEMYHRGELVRYDAPRELTDGTVTVRVYLRPVPTRELPSTAVPDVPTETYRAGRVWTAETISAVGFLGLVTVLLTVVYLSVAVLEVAAIVIVGSIALGGLLLLGSKIRGGGSGCPGIRIHCGGCR